MTTDATSAEDRAARLEALRRRRAAVRSDASACAHERARPFTPRPRRRHAASGARILSGSLSAATALGLMAAMAGTADPGSDAAVPTTTAAPTVIVIRRSTGATVVAPRAAPPVTAAVAPPVTTSRGS